MYDKLHTAVLNMYPQAAEIVDIQSYRPGYLPYPARVTLRTTSGLQIVCVLKASERLDMLAREAQVLRALTDLHLPVPQVLGGPVTTKDVNKPLVVLLLSELPGQPLPWLGLTDLATAHRTCQLLQEAVETLHALTPRIWAHPIATILPSITLEDELQTIITRGGPWFDIPVFTEAITLLQTSIPRYTTPLVFSNGDYNPLNFLVVDDTITGWIDFEHACFEDPYIGFAKFVLWADDEYGWGSGAKVGLVERYLYKHQVAPVAFLVRLLLRGLRHIQDADPLDPPHHMLRIVTDTVSRLTRILS
jgi:aminoglycoside phosphotransferase